MALCQPQILRDPNYTVLHSSSAWLSQSTDCICQRNTDRTVNFHGMKPKAQKTLHVTEHASVTLFVPCRWLQSCCKMFYNVATEDVSWTGLLRISVKLLCLQLTPTSTQSTHRQTYYLTSVIYDWVWNIGGITLRYKLPAHTAVIKTAIGLSDAVEYYVMKWAFSFDTLP